MSVRSKILAVLSLLLTAAFVLSACQPVVETVEVVRTEIVDREVEVVKTQEVFTTEIVEVEKGAYTNPHPILSDLRIRQAMAYCTNKVELIQSVYPLITPEAQQALVMDSFIPRTSWAFAGDENLNVYPFDADQGKALLDEAGWTLAEDADFRTNASGEQLSLKFTTTSAAFRQTWAAVWEQQMAGCGIQIVRLHAPASWWFGDTTGLARRDFELGAFAWVGQADPSGETLYACDQIPLPENNWEGQNDMGWCNEVANKNIKLANNTLVEEERVAAYTTVQSEYTKDVPALPLFNRTETYATAPGFEAFNPPTGTAYYMYNAHEWAIPNQDTLVLGWTQEPATLFSLVESALVANQALSFVDGYSYTDQDFNFQPVMLKQLATIENGAASNNDLEVKEGDKVYSLDGEPIELAAGVTVKDASGQEVEFSGSPVTMKQLVVTYEWVDGLTWSDGEPLKKADFELAFKINCDKESGSTTYITCDQIQNIEFVSDTSYTITYLPGVQSPIYFLPPWQYQNFYPSHRVLADGRKLADVPAKEWATLTEIAESPIGVGPYMVTEWTKGEKMVFEANPYYYLGEPKTKNLVISFLTPENAEAQLLGGQVDLLDGTTLSGVTEALDSAQKAGQIQIIVEPSATWEHIDFNLFLR